MLVASIALWFMVAPCSCDWFSDNSSDFWIATAGFEGLSFYKESDISTDNEENYTFLPYASKKQAQYLDYHWTKKLLFMTTFSDTINVEPSDNPYVTSGEVKGARQGIAVDWLSDLIFLEVCDSRKKRCAIEMYNFHWVNLGKVADIDGTLHRIVVDPYERIVFWLSLKHKDISMINYDSSEKRILLQQDAYSDKYIEMALDLANRRVIFVTQYEADVRLESTDYEGKERMIYLSNTIPYRYLYYGFGVYKDCAYWLAFDGSVQRERVYRVQLNDSNSLQTIISYPTIAFHMTVLHQQFQKDRVLVNRQMTTVAPETTPSPAQDEIAIPTEMPSPNNHPISDDDITESIHDNNPESSDVADEFARMTSDLETTTEAAKETAKEKRTSTSAGLETNYLDIGLSKERSLDETIEQFEDIHKKTETMIEASVLKITSTTSSISSTSTSATEAISPIPLDTGPESIPPEDLEKHFYVVGVTVLVFVLTTILLFCYFVRRYYRKRDRNSFIFTPPVTTATPKANVV